MPPPPPLGHSPIAMMMYYRTQIRSNVHFPVILIAYAPAPFGGRAGVRRGGIIKEEMTTEQYFRSLSAAGAPLFGTAALIASFESVQFHLSWNNEA
jgi:hypothetical protein